MDRILIVEDDPRMLRILSRIFLRERFEVNTADSGLVAIDKFIRQPPDAVLLDLVLPELSGREVCRRMKAASPEVSIIILSSIVDVVDKVLLLELGAEDYVTKPFSPRELLARVQSAIRRQRRVQSPLSQEVCRFGNCKIDFDQMHASCGERDVSMTTLEYKLLRFMVFHAGKVFTRESLLQQVWGYNAYPSTRTVDNQILKLRQKLEQDPANPVHLQTIYGAGYRFVY